MSSTATTAGAREHARAQEGTPTDHMPVVPASRAAGTPGAGGMPEGVGADDLVWADTVPGGSYAHRRLAAGTHVRLTDTTGDACAAVLLLNAHQPTERLNVADTVKVQWQVYAGVGQLLLSDQGRALASVVADTSGRHDSVYGVSTQARNEQRYGDGAPEGPSPAGRELLVVAATKHGLGRRDVPPCVSFFQGVEIDDGGRPRWRGSAGPGAAVTLRLEMDAIVLVATAAHPLDPREAYTAGPVEVLAWRGSPTLPTDDDWDRSPEVRRALENTTDYRKGL